MCGLCFNYDVPGNLHFGWIGRAASLRSWLLHFGAGLVQPGRWTDDPKDAAAVEIGEEMWDNGTDLCGQLHSRRSDLNLAGTGNCPICSVS
jgi:Bacterial toxin 44